MTDANSTAKTYALVLGVVLLLVGILGFVPALNPDGNELGIFAINGLHNVIHILTGVVGIAAATSAGGLYARWFAGIFGAVYALVTIVGFAQGNTVLGLIPANTADNLLHTAITLSALGVFFGTRSPVRSTVQATANRF